ncbi:hypothetical protein KIPB_014473, partial [Kipferlia bialata]
SSKGSDSGYAGHHGSHRGHDADRKGSVNHVSLDQVSESSEGYASSSRPGQIKGRKLKTHYKPYNMGDYRALSNMTKQQ